MGAASILPLPANERLQQPPDAWPLLDVLSPAGRAAAGLMGMPGRGRGPHRCGGLRSKRNSGGKRVAPWARPASLPDPALQRPIEWRAWRAGGAVGEGPALTPTAGPSAPTPCGPLTFAPGSNLAPNWRRRQLPGAKTSVQPRCPHGGLQAPRAPLPPRRCTHCVWPSHPTLRERPPAAQTPPSRAADAFAAASRYARPPARPVSLDGGWSAGGAPSRPPQRGQSRNAKTFAAGPLLLAQPDRGPVEGGGR